MRGWRAGGVCVPSARLPCLSAAESSLSHPISNLRLMRQLVWALSVAAMCLATAWRGCLGSLFHGGAAAECESSPEVCDVSAAAARHKVYMRVRAFMPLPGLVGMCVQVARRALDVCVRSHVRVAVGSEGHAQKAMGCRTASHCMSLRACPFWPSHHALHACKPSHVVQGTHRRAHSCTLAHTLAHACTPARTQHIYALALAKPNTFITMTLSAATMQNPLGSQAAAPTPAMSVRRA